MICFGIANAIAAGFAGGLAKTLGRFPMMLGTLCVHVALLIWMRLWLAVDSDYVAYCTMAAIWGLVDGVWLVQVNCKFIRIILHNALWPNLHLFIIAFYGVLFPGREEAAFSNFRLIEATGSVTTYVLSPVLCTGTKLELLGGLMILGMIGFSITEFQQRKVARQAGLEMANVTGDEPQFEKLPSPTIK